LVVGHLYAEAYTVCILISDVRLRLTAIGFLPPFNIDIMSTVDLLEHGNHLWTSSRFITGMRARRLLLTCRQTSSGSAECASPIHSNKSLTAHNNTFAVDVNAKFRKSIAKP